MLAVKEKGRITAELEGKEKRKCTQPTITVKDKGSLPTQHVWEKKRRKATGTVEKKMVLRSKNERKRKTVHPMGGSNPRPHD